MGKKFIKIMYSWFGEGVVSGVGTAELAYEQQAT